VKNYHSQLHNSNINFAQQGNKKAFGRQPDALVNPWLNHWLSES